MEVHELAAKIDAFAKETKEDLAMIKRGVYGDKANNVKGLLERQDSDEERIDKIERIQFKVGAVVSIIVIGLDVVWNIFKETILK